jgi:hypothetical protein
MDEDNSATSTPESDASRHVLVMAGGKGMPDVQGDTDKRGTVSYRRSMSATADLLASLNAISSETARMLARLDAAERIDVRGRREAKRRVLAIRREAQELIEWLSEVPLEQLSN